MAGNLTQGLCTSGSRLKVSVSDGRLWGSAQRSAFDQERVLLPLVRREVGRFNADLRAVRTVCAVRGPGRFTGIRISLTLAAALKALSGAVVRTVTLFEVLALQAAQSPHFASWSGSRRGRLAVLLHAFKDEHFCQFFAASPGRRPVPASEPAWLRSGEAGPLLAAQREPFYLVADAEESPGIYSLAPAAAAKAPPGISRVRPDYIIRAALLYGRAGLKPLYLKPAKYELQNNVSYFGG